MSLPVTLGSFFLCQHYEFLLRQLRTPAPLGWVTAYYAGWQYDRLKPAQIDFRALTHLVHFSVLPKADGTLDWQPHGITEARSQEVIQVRIRLGEKFCCAWAALRLHRPFAAPSTA
jgi:hypothetical protein